MQAVLQIGPFNYDELPSEKQALLKAITSDIAENSVIAVKAVERIGQRLADAKDLLDRGQWLNWLSSINMSHSTASNYMNVASNWGGTGIIEQVDLAPLCVLSTSRVKDEVREDFMKLVQRGEQLDEKAARALRDAPPTLRARYVTGGLSKQDFVDLAEEYKDTPPGSRAAAIRTLIDEKLTDARVAPQLYNHPNITMDDLEVAVRTGYLNFDAKPVEVENLTSELIELQGWQMKEPQDDDDSQDDGDESTPPLLKGDGQVVTISPDGVVTVSFRCDTSDLREGETYKFIVRE